MRRLQPDDALQPFPVLAVDPDPNVRRAIAANAEAPLELVEQLTRAADEMVARVATHNHDRRRKKANPHGRRTDV